MKRVLPSAFVGWFLKYAGNLKHPQLFKWISALFLIDLLIPDLVPFVDEILLGLATMFLASRKKDRDTSQQTPQEKTVKGETIDARAETVDRTESRQQKTHNTSSQDGHGKH
ncbi:DUF6116 family protein [uncultured Microbulbifer sp.]|uniref:DUF6116 family protein n=1 Tax=uncultured Microbulbifer sp. TaxID=348147 RepID=UPI0025ED11FF|nr:DUF6116 family protein [uncultured Microbulbifer sp.]